ncbi:MULTISPECIES: HupE/UreJ family protein [Alphaproteobacteria]|uniref:Urease accessory protein n=2 Tax=Alphaproteobacteria TaxID=28211 RepID=A0A512HEX8_9HYPH|nr:MULTISPECIES: HupE/UreJ family protein [Alphaproteobacteria]GEO83987.1 urease accessory protein [Ciceribacter naphthalenivorans]GLR21135.1 urease accessory protein [Ciceribacter naphthalenivorans]GLT03991.1 urease accessory protein [Sphingomonas psychrolutea]
MFKRLSITAAIFTAAAAPAFAHLDPAEHGSLMAGLSHPLSGADHILAMVAVGLWASQIGGRALLAVPAAFVGTMALGFLFAVSGIEVPFVEPAVLASVIGLGLLVATAARLPVAASAAVVGLFAFFHGHAHGGELGAAGALQFGIGFLVATAALHAAGVGLGIALGRMGPLVTRLLGALTALGGAALVLG